MVFYVSGVSPARVVCSDTCVSWWLHFNHRLSSIFIFLYVACVLITEERIRSSCRWVCTVSIPFSFSLDQDDDEVPLGTPDYDSLSENGLLSRNEPIRSKVSKLTEKLRKRYPTQPAGQTLPLSASHLHHLCFCVFLPRLWPLGNSFDKTSEFSVSLSLLTSLGNCSYCNAVFSVLKKRVRFTTFPKFFFCST